MSRPALLRCHSAPITHQGCIKSLAAFHLEPGVCLSKQNRAKEKVVCEQVGTLSSTLHLANDSSNLRQLLNFLS